MFSLLCCYIRCIREAKDGFENKGERQFLLPEKLNSNKSVDIFWYNMFSCEQ